MKDANLPGGLPKPATGVWKEAVKDGLPSRGDEASPFARPTEVPAASSSTL